MNHIEDQIDTLFKEFSDFTHPLLEGKLSKVLKSFIFKTVLCCELFHQEEQKKEDEKTEAESDSIPLEE